MNNILDNGEGDYRSKVLFAKFLTERGFYDIQTTMKGWYWDLEAMKDGVQYYFEIKDRRPRFASDTKGDSIIETLKFDNIMKECPEPKKMYIVNIFTDNKIAIFPLLSEHHLEDHLARKTYYWGGNIVPKTFVSYLNRPPYIYDYETGSN